MTGEGEKKTEAWIEKHGAEYPYAYDKKKALSRQLGVKGIPHAFLINPAGTIVWRGHPSSLKAGIIEEHLKGALTRPIWEWPKELGTVKKALLKRQLAKALTAVEKLAGNDPGFAKYRDTVKSIISGKIESMKSKLEAGDYLAARDLAGALRKQLAGLPEAAEASKVLETIAADKSAKAVMTAQKRLAKLRGERIRKRKDAEKVIKQLHKLVRKLPGTHVEAEARKLIDELRERSRKLR